MLDNGTTDLRYPAFKRKSDSPCSVRQDHSLSFDTTVQPDFDALIQNARLIRSESRMLEIGLSRLHQELQSSIADNIHRNPVDPPA
jgi:hypothetical protein